MKYNYMAVSITYIRNVIRSFSILPTIVWLICILILSFSPWKYSWILYPVCTVILVYPYRNVILHWISEYRVIILGQIIFSALYLLFHAPQILALELWSDEIFSLRIAENAFERIAKSALTQSVIPPYHYWELWFWRTSIAFIPTYQIEIFYRIPSMAYHTVSAILFAWFISSKSNVNVRGWQYIVNGVSFLSFYFNPLLFPFALEVRPYAAMVLGGVLSLIAIDSKEFMSIRYIPVQLTLFTISFFHAISWIPIGIYLWVRSYKKMFFIYVLTLAVLYLSFMPYIRMPDHSTKEIVVFAINRSMYVISSVFASNYFSIGMLLLSCFYVFSKRSNYLPLFQICSLWMYSIVLGYMIQYTAFAPRHLILSFPIFIYFLFMPLFNMKILRAQILFLVCICMFFTLPWMRKTETMITTLQFAPKISIGIKKAITQAQNQRRDIALGIIPVTFHDPLYFTYTYMEYISLWYIEQYHIRPPIRMNGSEFCTSNNDKLYYIGFEQLPCDEKKHNASILQFKIQE